MTPRTTRRAVTPVTSNPGHSCVRGPRTQQASPDPPQNHQGTTAPAIHAAAADPAARMAADVGEFFERLAGLNPRWQMTVSQRRRLSPAVAAALAAGRTPLALAETAGANIDGVRSPYAVLAARLTPAELPGPPARAVRPPWCGQCDERTRMLGFDSDAPAPLPALQTPPRPGSGTGANPRTRPSRPPARTSPIAQPTADQPSHPLSADDDHHAVLPPRRKVPHE